MKIRWNWLCTESVPPGGACLAAAEAAGWACGLCGRVIFDGEPWLTRVTDMAPIHEVCALADPAVKRIEAGL